MDWNLKATSWDLSEFEQEAVPNIDASDGSSTLGGPRTRKDFSVDLKLGHVGHSGDESMNKWKDPGISKTESSPSGSSKRARAANSGTQTVSCLVDGCNADLSNCRDYHRRHKVCELHSKTPQVMINGQKQRFCQQCSRFHSLEEFDEGKRSCRKRLDGHNRRRRKPQPDPLSRPGSFLSSYQGTQLLPLSNSHVYPSTNVVNPTWAGVVNTEMDARHYNQQRPLHSPERQNFFLGSSPGSSYKAGKQFQFLPGDGPCLNHQTSQEASICQPLLRAVPMSESGGGHSMFCDRLTTRVHDSDCALSLLSSPQTQTSGISLSHMVQPSSIPLVQPGSISLVQPLGPGLNKHSFEPMDSVLVSNSRDANDHYSGMFPIGSDGLSSANEASQTLPFHWG